MLIDPVDEARVACRKWRQHKGYWITSHYQDFQNRPVFLHHCLMGMPLDRSLEVDHKNRNPDDNRISNLHFVTHRENTNNRSLDKRNKSGVTGIGPVTARTTKRSKAYVYHYWRVQVRTGNGRKTLGYFKSKRLALEARRTYEKAKV